MLKILLNKISKIDSGKSFRNRIEDDPNGSCWVIQMKDISNEQLAITGNPQSILLNEINPSQLLKKGDILFMAKGNNNFAVMYNSEQPAVAVSLFFIIRPDFKVIDPEYLTWFLNSPSAQMYFHERRLGASVGNIRKDTLEELEIDFPSMEKQKQIAFLNRLIQEEKKITHEYLETKGLYMNQILLNLAKQQNDN